MRHPSVIRSPLPFVTLRRVGGLMHWRVGPIGGSFYRTARPVPRPLAASAYRSTGDELARWCIAGVAAFVIPFALVALVMG